MSRDPTPDLLFPTCADCEGMGVDLPDWLPAMEAELGFEAVKAFLLRTHPVSTAAQGVRILTS